MNCPVCSVALTMSDRQGVEIDYCPKCRGVWLDRGELDKIIERSAGGEQTTFERAALRRTRPLSETARRAQLRSQKKEKRIVPRRPVRLLVLTRRHCDFRFYFRVFCSVVDDNSSKPAAED